MLSVTCRTVPFPSQLQIIYLNIIFLSHNLYMLFDNHDDTSYHHDCRYAYIHIFAKQNHPDP